MTDLQAAFQYLITVEVLGILAWPLTRKLLGSLSDQGWAFSKVIGITLLGWIVWLLAILQIAPFTLPTILVVLGIYTIGTLVWLYKNNPQIFGKRSAWPTKFKKLPWRVIIGEELLLIGIFATWTYLRGFAPDIIGLEKYMDYGFVNSILRAKYFPPLDHFLARENINYYYFGHYLTAFLTKLSQVPVNFTYNLQMSLIFALAFVESFSLGSWLISKFTPHRGWQTISGLLSATLINLSGNFHAVIYLIFGSDSYWYPNATRFVENTIHEFPIYSYIVNDLHAHVNNIPLVLLIITLLAAYFFKKRDHALSLDFKFYKLRFPFLLIPLGFAIGISYMTNAWDFAIYSFLTGLVLWVGEAFKSDSGLPPPWLDKLLRQLLSLVKRWNITQKLFTRLVLLKTFTYLLVVLTLSVLISFPFWLTVSPASQGIGIVPLGAQSPIWQWVIIWGVQVSLAILFLASFKKLSPVNLSLARFLALLSLAGIFLLLVPEIIYLKDIYPTHYRANTLFKFGYQAWIILGIVGGVGTTLVCYYYKNSSKPTTYLVKGIGLLVIIASLVYTPKAIKQGLNGLNNHQSINGTLYLARTQPADYKAINWLNKNIKGQPTIVEAVGESYTKYARISVNTGLPTVLGWPVHEWLWRGSYNEPMVPETKLQKRTGKTDTVVQRKTDIRALYTTKDPTVARSLIKKYRIEYIYLGPLEGEKYPELNEKLLKQVTERTIYDTKEVRIYKTK